MTRIVCGAFHFLAAPFERHMAGEGLCTPDYFTGFELTGRWTRKAIEDTLSYLPHGITELMCHPGYCDPDLEASPTRLKRQREVELAIVADELLRTQTAGLGIQLRGFSGSPSTAAQIEHTPLWHPAASAGRE